MNKEEIMSMSKQQLESTVENLRSEYYKLLNKKQTEKKVDKPHMFKAIRKNIARAKTVLNKESS